MLDNLTRKDEVVKVDLTANDLALIIDGLVSTISKGESDPEGFDELVSSVELYRKLAKALEDAGIEFTS